MQKWPRFIFVLYAIAVVIALGMILSPLPPGIFQQWMTVSSRLNDFGPIQSEARALADGAPSTDIEVRELEPTGPSFTSSIRAWRESEIKLQLPGGDTNRERIRHLANHDGAFYLIAANSFVSLDREGALRWSFEPEDRLKIREARFSFSGSSVFVSTDAGRIYCLDVVSGRLQWMYQLEEKADLISAVVSSRRIATSISSARGTELLMLDSWNGKVLWRSQSPSNAAALAMFASGDELIVVHENSYYRFDSIDGGLRSKVDFLGTAIAAIFSRRLQTLVLLKVGENLEAVAVGTGETRWHRLLKRPAAKKISTFVFSEKRIGFWAFDEGGQLSFVDALNGVETSRARTKRSVEGDVTIDGASLVMQSREGDGLVRLQ